MASGSGPAAKKTKTIVEFVGPGREVTERIINAADFTRNDVANGPGKTTWNEANGWIVDASEWSKGAVDFMEKQGDFKVTKADVEPDQPVT